MFEKYLFEFIGTMVLILLGDGVCAATSLDKSKAKGAGWIVVTMGWGFAVTYWQVKLKLEDRRPVKTYKLGKFKVNAIPLLSLEFYHFTL